MFVTSKNVKWCRLIWVTLYVDSTVCNFVTKWPHAEFRQYTNERCQCRSNQFSSRSSLYYMRYINPRFTYLLTYLLTPPFRSVRQDCL